MFKNVCIIYKVMKEKTLLKIALISSLIGILLLLFISTRLKINEKSISKIDEKDMGYNVMVNGIVSDVQNRGSVILIEVADLEKIDVVIFNANLTLNKGDLIEVSGKLDEYEGKQQLVADKIILK